MTQTFDISNRAIDRYRTIRHIPLDTSGEALRAELREAAIVAYRNGDVENRPVWWTGECEYLLRVRGKGPDLFFVVRRDETEGRLVVVTVHSYDDMSRFERRQRESGTTTKDEASEQSERSTGYVLIRRPESNGPWVVESVTTAAPEAEIGKLLMEGKGGEVVIAEIVRRLRV